MHHWLVRQVRRAETVGVNLSRLGVEPSVD